jgi:hypothetical protein
LANLPDARTGALRFAPATVIDQENIGMSDHTKATPGRASHANATSTGAGPSQEATEAQGSAAERIRLRAYELYIQRGAQPNDDLRDWLQAEQEIRQATSVGGPDSKLGQRT